MSASPALLIVCSEQIRVIVSDIAGTTRDAVDTPFEMGGKKYVIIDTAGMRKKKFDERTIRWKTIRLCALSGRFRVRTS